MKYNKFYIFSILVILLFVAANCSFQVKFLPGFQGPLPFELETGYIGVGEGDNVQLFYYFVKSQTNPDTDPLILWLTGGPGCSALSGLIYEIGPLRIKEVFDGRSPTLVANPYSWTEAANIIFLDLPVGTGFSYARTTESSHSNDTQTCDHAYQFMQNWLDDHVEFTSSPFYVGGDSSVGLTSPVIVQMISDGNNAGKSNINMKGYILGNPITFPDETNYVIPYAHGMALIPDELYESLKTNCGGEYNHVEPSNLLCNQDVQTFQQLTVDVNIWHILQPKCSEPRLRLRFDRLSEKRRYLNEQFQHCDGEWYQLSVEWINDDTVLEALGIRKETIKIWKRCNSSLSYNISVWDSRPYHALLSSRGFRSLIYNGDHDMVVPFFSTQAWIKLMNYTIVDEWRPWRAEGQLAGYTRSYANNMTFATVKGGGHVAPMLYPMECAAMFKRWISHQPL